MSSTTARNPNFTPDVNDQYILELSTATESGVIPLGTVTITAMLPFGFESIEVGHGSVALNLYGAIGSVFALQFRTELETVNVWHSLANVTLTNTPQAYVDSGAIEVNRFYRMLLKYP